MVERSPGMNRESSGLRVGRQAQMIPVLHSMADQDAAPTLSSRVVNGIRWFLQDGLGSKHVHVGSDESEILFRLTRRMILVTQTLVGEVSR